ncbi:MAG: hypothetical protein KAH01_03155 [Caldisericia bacterium]|nr:hypothetical protein [Caldisericia bacterium]
MWLLPASIYFITIILFFLLSLQKKYKWNGVFLYKSFYLQPPVIFFYFWFSRYYASYNLSVHSVTIFSLASLTILLIIYWIAKKKAKNTILIFGIHPDNCREYLSRLTQNLGFPNPNISNVKRLWTGINHFNGRRPTFKVASKDASHYFRIQFGYFTRIDICETQYEIDETQVKNFKETCWKTFDELSDNHLIAPYIIGLLSILVLSGILILFKSDDFFSYLIDYSSGILDLIILILPQIALRYFICIPYGMEIVELLPDID